MKRISIMPGACRPHEIEQMRRQTHDGVIEIAGDKRRSGVTWHETRGAQACRRTLIALYADDARPDTEVYLAQFLEYFEEAGDDAVLIVATCVVDL